MTVKTPMRILVMAGGTGGHVFPALAVAQCLAERKVEVVWLGAEGGLECKLVPKYGYSLHAVRICGIRGRGIGQWMRAPFNVLTGIWDALGLLRRVRPTVVLGMGGYVSAPGGIGAFLRRLPLLIHEQNARAGTANRLLAPFAARIMQAFPATFRASGKLVHTGNPVRREICRLHGVAPRKQDARTPMHLLILGGSQGAACLNKALPAALALLEGKIRPQVIHQTGECHYDSVLASYAQCRVNADVRAFIDDMAEAYCWADLVICRAGAMTIAELTAAGRASILVPFARAVDNHQTANAHYLSGAGAAVLLPESECTPKALARSLASLQDNPKELVAMAKRAHERFIPDAAERIAEQCLELAHA
ncbi:MAG: undecaprenyldiphospho-muramoylpentapeptide beta-N-acetylglucosaminyltransferase [Candidatus Eutrophobiaceae bacterium]